jgi:hypothetical protein
LSSSGEICRKKKSARALTLLLDRTNTLGPHPEKHRHKRVDARL